MSDLEARGPVPGSPRPGPAPGAGRAVPAEKAISAPTEPVSPTPVPPTSASVLAGSGPATLAASTPTSPATSASEDGLLGRIELIEAQPLPQRAAGFEQLHDELLADLQRGDHGGV